MAEGEIEQPLQTLVVEGKDEKRQQELPYVLTEAAGKGIPPGCFLKDMIYITRAEDLSTCPPERSEDSAEELQSFGQAPLLDEKVLETDCEERPNNRRPRLLALHGRMSNSCVTELQISNMCLETLFDVEYCDGLIRCEGDRSDDMIGISGPFFSWVSDMATSSEISEAVNHVTEKARQADFIFGFSQGAAIALAAAAQLQSSGRIAPPCLCVCPAGIRILELLEIQTLPVEAVFCMGLGDPFKTESEKMLSFLSLPAATFYMDSGHGVPQSTVNDANLHSHLYEWLAKFKPDINSYIPEGLPLATCLVPARGSGLRSKMIEAGDGLKESQMVQWTQAKPWFDSAASSMLDMLMKQESDKIVFWDGGEETSCTYGQLVNFIHGEGNLSKFGIQRADDVVSYIVEEGALSAVLFVVIASQCSVAPLGASSTEDDLSDAFVQLSARMVIASNGLQEKALAAVKTAQHSNESSGSCELGLVVVESSKLFAGSFYFLGPLAKLSAGSQYAAVIDSKSSLPDASVEAHLFLRTSGTTSKPKVVPLAMKSVIANGSGIAKSLGLTADDICINAMPLFHIGGLSASILSTLASGGSTICMPGFQPEAFVRMLCRSLGPQPTWYSAVPTIHLALLEHVRQSPSATIPREAHSLRFIRSGAASLSMQSAKDMQELWGCPVLPTYSMTEQMPISQPPIGYDLSHPGSVGIPMVTVAIVDNLLRPLPVCPPEKEPKDFFGEICISGWTVMNGYAQNEEANANSFFYLGGERYFRTGDVGFLDSDSYLHLTGREKELIKVGGEQVSPFVIEEILYSHPSVQVALAFGIPNELLNEVVAAAVVPRHIMSAAEEKTFLAELRQLFVTKGVPAYQIPRVRLSSEIDFTYSQSSKINRKKTRNSFIAQFTDLEHKRADADHTSGLDDATLGVRFLLSMVVCLNHIGDHAWPFEDSPESDPWSSAVTSARTIGDLGVVCFGMLAGLMMATSIKEPIKSGQYAKFFESRLVPIHLMYLIASALCCINRLFMCPPSDFQPYTYGSLETCRATALEWSWGGTWLASIVLSVLNLQAWPIGTLVWHISYYTWFSSAYQFCVFCFPFIHRLLQRAMRSACAVRLGHLGVHILHYLTLVFMESVYLSMRFKDPVFANYFIYAGYMFPPFWVVRFACGVMLGLTFLKYHAQPSQKSSAVQWAVLTDFLTFLLLLTYVLLISFQVGSKHRISTVTLLEDRMYCGVIPRLMTPLLCIWLYGLAVGRGFTAWFCRNPFLVKVLSPASYSIYLLHQPVFEWYSASVKGRWWGQRKPGFEWFSPDPIQLGALETIVVILLTVAFSIVVTYVANTHLMGRWLSLVRFMTCRRRAACGNDVKVMVLCAIEDLTGVCPELNDNLQDTGLASLGVAALVSTLNSSNGIQLTAAQIVGCDTVSDVIAVIQAWQVTHGKS
jgi:acyl-CoA synthetase (AMP-forming)/AMP-acid ligase II